MDSNFEYSDKRYFCIYKYWYSMADGWQLGEYTLIWSYNIRFHNNLFARKKTEHTHFLFIFLLPLPLKRKRTETKEKRNWKYTQRHNTKRNRC